MQPVTQGRLVLVGGLIGVKYVVSTLNVFLLTHHLISQTCCNPFPSPQIYHHVLIAVVDRPSSGNKAVFFFKSNDIPCNHQKV